MTSRGHLIPLFFRRWIDTLAPRPCAVCGMRLGACEQLVCVGCNLSLPRTGYALNPYDNDMAMLFWHLASVEKAAALFFYKAGSPTARAIYKLKYYSRPDIGYGLGQLMARELAANGFFDDINLIVPVPLAPKRKRQRGYNQSEAIAAGLAHETGIGMDAQSLRRTSFHQSQTHLSRQERQENVAGVFSVARPKRLEHRSVLLVDDVCTTGATLSACVCELAKVQGVRVSVATLAFAGTRFDDDMRPLDPDRLIGQTGPTTI